MNKPFLSVIIPAYNEARRVPLALIDIDKHLFSAEYSYEIIVVNDGSTDATADVVRRFMPLIKNLKLIDNRENNGKGAAVKQGMREARGTIKLFTDADNSTSIDQFNKMIPLFKEGHSVVIGSRNARGALLNPPQPLYRRVLGRLGGLFIRILLIPNISDTQCGFKAFTEEAADKIFSHAKIKRWGFDIEILALADKMGCKVREIPVTWVNNTFSHFRFVDYFQVLWETLKIRWWLSKDKYNLV